MLAWMDSLRIMKNRSYRELIRLPTFEERFEYLSLKGEVGSRTFGSERWINQAFYKSPEWLNVRRHVIIRDDGCDLGFEDNPISHRVLVHHINPITPDDFSRNIDMVLNPENLISVSHNTHNAIHYGNADLLKSRYTPRQPNDTKLW